MMRKRNDKYDKLSRGVENLLMITLHLIVLVVHKEPLEKQRMITSLVDYETVIVMTIASLTRQIHKIVNFILVIVVLVVVHLLKIN